MAGALAALCRRPADLVARYGGEEFALVLPETDAAGGRAVLESALAGLDSLAVAPAPAARVTASLGAVSLPPAEGQPASAALETADRLLYAAKSGGRRRAVHLDMSTGATETIVPAGGLP